MSRKNNGRDSTPEIGDINDRRTSRRFPLRLALRYRRTGSSPASNWMSGESLNISSTGLLFTTTEAVQPGQGIEAFVAWPVCLDKRIPLKLVIKGSIVRNTGDHTAICFERYEFKTSQMPPDANLKPEL
jgi:hypothetical protein